MSLRYPTVATRSPWLPHTIELVVEQAKNARGEPVGVPEVKEMSARIEIKQVELMEGQVRQRRQGCSATLPGTAREWVKTGRDFKWSGTHGDGETYTIIAVYGKPDGWGEFDRMAIDAVLKPGSARPPSP